MPRSRTTPFLEARRRFEAKGHRIDQTEVLGGLARTTLQARILAAQYQVDLARRDADRQCLENACLSEARTGVAARFDAARSGKSLGVVQEVTVESFRPLGLSRRESEILLWVVRGKANDEFAIIPGAGAETVTTHLKRIIQHLDVNSRAAATVRAVTFFTRSLWPRPTSHCWHGSGAGMSATSGGALTHVFSDTSFAKQPFPP